MIAKTIVVLAAVLYVVVRTDLEMSIQTVATLDDMYFLDIARNIAAGDWLGTYDKLTFIKGAGYPAFLALNHFFGAPINWTEAVLRALSCGALFIVLRSLVGALAAAVIGAVVLFVPSIFTSDFSRILRDGFYICLVLFLLASIAAYLKSDLYADRRRIWLVGIPAGLCAAAIHLTREEGVWLLPPLVLAFSGAFMVARRRGAPVGRWAGAAAVPVVAAMCAVLAVGLANRVIYGRFVVNDIKGGEFQQALVALQRASYPYWEPYLPVPKAARQRIYEVSPSFAALRSWIDPPSGAVPMQIGCGQRLYLNTCGDIAGGWFLWVFRGSAGQAGFHGSPAQAAKFYAAIAREVNAACDRGELTCAAWMPPLIPPMVGSQIWTLPESAWKVYQSVSLRHRLHWQANFSTMDFATESTLMHLLNYPRIRTVGNVERLTYSGWYHRPGAGWFRLSEPDGGGRTEVERRASLDLVQAFRDDQAERQRFQVTVPCQPGRPCGLRVVTDDGLTGALLLGQGGFAHSLRLGEGQFHIDSITPFPPPPRTLRTVLREKVLAGLETVRPFYTILVDTGPFAFLFVLVRAIRRRTLTPGLVLAGVIGTALASRLALLTLVQASSFPVANYLYTGVAVHLAVLFALVSWALALGFERGGQEGEQEGGQEGGQEGAQGARGA